MKPFKTLIIATSILFSLSASAQTDSTTFKVSGNCGMCKKRIETSVTGPSVTSANWNEKSKTMTVEFDSTKTNADLLQQKVAAVGHDTEKYAAEKAVYNKLPGCCLYDRTLHEKEKPNEEHHNR